MACRVVLFIDGNNWFYSLKEIGLTRLGSLDYRKISLKLILTREWIETRYYIGRVRRTHTTKLKLYDDQRQFLAKLKRDQRISTHLGRLEPRIVAGGATRPSRNRSKLYQSSFGWHTRNSLLRSLAMSKENGTSATTTLTRFLAPSVTRFHASHRTGLVRPRPLRTAHFGSLRH